MKYKKIISFVCLTTIFSQSIPTSLLSYAYEANKMEQSENVKEENESTKKEEDSDSNTKVDENKEEKEKKQSLENNTFNAYIDGVDELAFSLGFDSKEGKFTVKDRSDKELSNKNPDSMIYKINVYDKDNKEKIAIELTGKDTGKSNKLDILSETKYEIGDRIQIIPLKPKDGLKILGEIKGNIENDKEDYSDGIDNYDYIHNVRFEITEDGLKSVYNEAPVIHGLDAVDEKLNGLKVTDDHDGVIPNSKVKVTEDEKTITYTVTDSWGRSTSATKTKVETYTREEKAPEQTPQTLADNTITVKGVPFIVNGQEEDIRFNVNFDIANKTINITNQDAKIFSSSSEEYFKFKLHSKSGDVKKEVTLNGRDRSDSEKLDVINGINYEIGDYISIWHAESDTKLNIAGKVKGENTQNVTGPPEEETDGSTPDSDGTPQGKEASNPDTPSTDSDRLQEEYDFNGGVDKNLLNKRFRLTDTGLTLVTNNAPKIFGADSDLEVSRGEKADLLKGVTANDDLDGNLTQKIEVDDLDTTVSGEHKVEYKVTDSWGVETKVERKVIVHTKNDIDSLTIGVKNKDGNNFFTLGFDELKKELKVTDKVTSGSIDDSDNKDTVIIRVYNKFGLIKKTFRLKGSTQINSNVISSINGFKYVEGDYISVWSKDYEKFVKIKGNIQPEESIIYPSYTDKDFLDNGRFELKEGNVTFIYNTAPSITGAENKTIKRGEVFNPLDGVEVTDDRDKDISKDNLTLTYDAGITSDTISQTEGSYNLIYKIKDSWGREATHNRTIHVEPKNKLEASTIELKSNIETKSDDNVMLKIGFDSIKKELRVIYFNEKLYVSGNSEDTAFKITIYNSKKGKKNEKGSFELKKDAILTLSDIERIESLYIDEGDIISIEAYDPKDGVAIKGEIVTSTGSYENGFTSGKLEPLDVMNNTKFTITNNGLDDVYNEAPEFTGLDELHVVKGNEPNLREGVSAKDEDGNINFEVEDNIKTDTIGSYDVEYTAVDIWGRGTTKTRTVHVVAEYYEQNIELKNDNNERLFTIGINRFGNGFILSNVKSDATTTQSGDSGNVNLPEENTGTEGPMFVLRVFDTEGKEVGKVELLNSTADELKKLEKLKNITLRQGYTFSIWSNDPKKLIVKGNIDKDNEDNGGFQDEDYSDGIDDSDFMNNVRFTVSGEKLKALYNKAPVITFENNDDNNEKNADANNTNAVFYRGEAPKLATGVIIKDDRDTLDATNLKITMNDKVVTEEDLNKLDPGDTGTLKYEITDSWGRKSEIVDRTVDIKHGMARHKIELSSVKSPDAPEVKSIVFGFNPDTMKFDIEYRDPDNGQLLGWVNSEIYKIEVYNSDKTNKKLDLSITGTWVPNYKGYNQLANLVFEKGDILKIKTGQGPRLKIHGDMTNTKNNYTDGIKSGYILENSEFKVTDEGFEEIIKEPVTITDKQNSISLLTGFSGNLFLEAKINRDKKNIEPVKGTNNETRLEMNHKSSKMFDVNYYRTNGSLIKTVSFTGNDGNTTQAEIDRFKLTNFEYGDYFTIENLHEKIAKNFRILGPIISKSKIAIEDFSDGIDNLDDISNLKFVFTEEGIEVHRKPWHTINVPGEVVEPWMPSGVDGYVYLPQQSGKHDVSTNVTATNDDGETFEVKANRKEVNVQNWKVDDFSTVDYESTDSWNRTLKKKIRYIAKHRLLFNKIKVYRKNDKENPAFEIGFEPKNGKYKKFTFKSYTDEIMDSADNPDSVFKIWVLDRNNKVKFEADIKGLDQANTDKFDDLKNLEFEFGDKIKVWSAGDNSEDSNKIDTLKIDGYITGDVEKGKEDYSDGIDNIDYMNNVVFELTEDGFKSIYNDAPEFKGVEDKVIYKGDTFNALDGVSVSDTEDVTIPNDDIDIIDTVIPNRIGEYTVTYSVTDSWGRTTQKEITVKVVSQVVKNTIDFYSSPTSKTEEKKFSLGFDPDTNKFKVTIHENRNSKNQYTGDNTHTAIVIFDRYGKIIKKVELNGLESNDLAILETLNEVSYNANYSIQVYSANPSNVRINGDVLGQSEEYKDGFTNVDKMKTTRFKTTEEGLKEVRAGDAKFDVLTDMTITRGEQVNPLDGVTITHPTEDVNMENIKIEGFNPLVIGEHTVTIKYIDSWGKEHTATRKLIVKPRNELEKNIINLVNKNDNSKIIDISFDTIEEKLTASIGSTNLEELDSEEVLMTLGIFTANHESKSEIEITKANIIDGSIETEIKNTSFEEDDYISIDAYDIECIKIQGSIKDQRENYRGGVDKLDHIKNVRFQLQEEGFRSQYNEAPEFEGLVEAEIFKGEEFNLLNGVTVTDDLDKEIDPNTITFDTDLDADTLGRKVLKYSVEDSWGRKATQERIIWVKSKVDSNKAEFYNSSEELLFSIGFDSKTNQYKLNKGSVDDPFDSSLGDGTAIKFTIYNEDGVKVKEIDLKGNETVDSEKLTTLSQQNYEYGRSINISVSNLNTNIKVKASGEIFKDEYLNNKIDYSQYVTNSDYLDNVRFTITELGIHATYNKAPVITVPEGVLEKFKSKDYKDYNLLEDVTVSDDKDDLKVEAIKINTKSRNSGDQDIDKDESNQEKHDEILNQKLDNLGKHTITYSITDSWGRPAEVKTRELNLTSSIDKNIMHFAAFTRNTPEMRGLKLQFSHNEMKIKTEFLGSIQGPLKDGIFSFHSNTLELYRIKHFDKDGKLKFEEIIRSNTTVKGLADKLNNKDFEYGDKLKLTTNQGRLLKIAGPTIGAAEDYLDGVDYGYILANTEFTITENGLEAEVSDDYQDNPKENTITWLAGYNGLIGARIRLDRSEMKLKVEDMNETHVDTADHTEKTVFSIKVFDENGQQKRKEGLTKEQSSNYGEYHGRSEIKRTLHPQYNDMEFKVGDYIELRVPKENRRGNLRLSGKITPNENNKKELESYEDGIDDVDNIDNVRFYITEDGLEAKYNEAPKIIGADDAVIVKGRPETNLIGIKVEDDHDIINPEDIEIVGSINNNQIGAYLLTYKATDSWGRVGEADRFAVVQAPPVITISKDKKIVEMGSVPSDQIDTYLKTKVAIITDEEDDRDKKKLKIDLETNFDPDVVGTYPITYKVTDSDGHVTTASVDINVVKTINVDVPIKMPFQVVTNLKDKDADQFISGVMNVNNNNIHNAVDVTVKSFKKVDGSGELSIVKPETVTDWENLSKEDTMKKLALGMYNKSGFIDSELTQQNPLWFEDNMTTPMSVGQLEKATSLRTPSNGKISFVSKHGKNFMGGNIRGKFELVLEFK